MRPFLLIVFLLIQIQFSNAQAELGIIPIPKILTEVENHLNLTALSNIVYTDPILQALANILQEDITKITGLTLTVTSGTSGNGDIELGLDSSLPDEGYTLDVNSKIVITGKDYRAAVWGTSSLLQAMNSDASIKQISINDSPDTGYRGLMVDLARQWHPVQNLEDIINMCRLYKVNFLHLHLMDTQYYTFPSTAYPLLTSPVKSYTLAEMHALEAYSQARGVTIVPELEVPGHATRMIQSYPDLFGSGTGGAINMASADVRAAVGELVAEIADVFQATPYMHIGCDEVDKAGMGEHPDYISAIAELGVENVDGLFNYFIDEVSTYVEAEGKRALAWEGFNSSRTGAAEVNKNLIVCPFDNYGDAGNEYAQHGHDILNTSWYPLYLIGSTYVPVEKIYDWEITEFGRYASAYPFSHNNPYQFTMTYPDKIIGAQTCSWEQKAEWEIPSLRSRVSPMSERIWNMNAGRTFDDYSERFEKSDIVLQAILATAVPEAITPSASYEIFPDKISVQWRGEQQYPSSYTLYRSTSDNSTSATPILTNTTLTAYEDTNITAGQTYYYWIKAHNSIGTSAFGNSADGRTGNATLVDMYEPFDYAANSGLNGLNGGTGFSSGWNITMDNGTAQVVSQSLDYPNLMTTGNSLSIDMTGGSASFLAERQLSGSFSPEGSEVWISFLMKANKAASGHFFVNIGDGRIGKKWGNGIYSIGTNVQLELVNGQTNLIVVKMESLNGNDNLHIWTNPLVDGAAPDLNAPSHYFTDREDWGTNPRIQLNTQYHGEGRYQVDEFRIGDSYEDVLPPIVNCPDSDGDTVCDDIDICPDGDDNIDSNNNGTPDACEAGFCVQAAAEAFDYPANTTIDNTNGGSGFGDAWSIPNAMNGAMEVLAGSLNFSGDNTSGNKLRMTLQNEDATKWVSRSLANPFQNGEEVWISCLINPIVRADGGFWIKPNNRQDIAFGKRWGSQIAINNNGSTTNVQENQTYKLVVRYKLEANQTLAHLWVNRNDNFTDANADAIQTIGAISDISSLTIAMERWGDGVMEMDELKIDCAAPCPTGIDCDDCSNLLPQQAVPVIGEGKMIIIRGVDTATHTWQNTDADLNTFITEMDSYIRKTSFNKTWITAEMTPVYNFTVDPNNNGPGPMSSQLRALAINDGYDIDNYNIVAYIHNSTTDFYGAGALGSGSNFKGTLYSNNSLSWYYKGNIHEVFHTLSVGHAETIEGGEAIYPGQVTGGHDPYHFMGSEGDGGLNSDIPNYMKYYLGWINPAEVHCLPSVTGCTTRRIYKYSLVNTYNNQHDYAVQLKDNLWLSYEPDNQNTRIEKDGVLLHYIPGPGSEVTRLLDVNPGSITDLPAGVSSSYLPVVDFWDAAMVVGDVVNYDGVDISMTATGGTGDEKWVDIQFCDCLVVSGDDDNDGVCNDLDVCAGNDDNADMDGDGTPDACDICPESPTDDLNGDNICDNLQCIQEAVESFDYTANTSIHTLNGGSGFQDGWSIPNPMNGSIEVLSGSLNYINQADSGNKLRVTLQNEDATKWINRNLEYPFRTGNEVWVSCLIQPIVRADGGFWIKPNNRQDIAIGKRWGSQIAINNNGSSTNVQENQTYKLVVRYKLEANQTIAHLWVNRNDNFTDANADASQTIGAISEINSLTISMERWGDGIMEIDELYIGCEPPPIACIDVQLQANLEGTYDENTNQMTNKLQSRGLLPGQTPTSNLATPTPAGQPYNIAPWNYNGTEGAAWTNADYTGNETDWVLVSFRTGTAKSTEVAMTAALLMKDGSIEFPDRCTLTSTVASPLYIVLEHRNHIGIMTPQPIDIVNGVLSYDFRNSDSYRDATSFGQKQSPTGEWMMFAGDADQMDFPSFDVNGTDKTEWFENNGVFDYYLSPDFNLDGDVNGQDKSLWFENNGISSRVPK